MRKALYGAVSVLALGSASASAQESGFYIGLGGQAYSYSSHDHNVSTYEQNGNALVVLGGYSFALGGLSLGFEVDTADTSAGQLPGNQVDLLRTTHARAMLGYPIENGQVFVALGRVMATADRAQNGGGTSLNGTTIGLGSELPVTERLDLRIEAFQDRLKGSFSSKNLVWQNTSVRAAAIFRF